jgi:hypothetical protein
MLLATSTAEALQRQRQVHVNGKDYTLAEYVGAAPLRGKYVEGNESNDNGLPQGFLVTQPPGSVTPPHFHETNQFQVFVAGSGFMGKHAAAPLTVQYANGHTPYGPIIAGEQGVRYFTLRQRWDPGAKYMPASRDRLAKGNQRARIRSGLPVSTSAERAARTSAEVLTVLEPEGDGLAAWLHYLPAAARVDLPELSRGGGQYLIVTSGMLRLEARDYSELSTVFVSADEPAPELLAGGAGLDLLVLQFPRLAQ